MYNFLVQAVLRDVLVKFLPEDVHTRSSGRVRGMFIYWVIKLLLVFFLLDLLKLCPE